MTTEDKGVEAPVKSELEVANEQIAKLTEERDNYKTVALKRLGKLPGDAAFIQKEVEEPKEGEPKKELSVEDQVKLSLMEREIQAAQKAKDEAIAKLARENSELKLALKNQPNLSIGGDSGASTATKDNVFTPVQIEALRQKAIRLKADPEKFIQAAKDNLVKRS